MDIISAVVDTSGYMSNGRPEYLEACFGWVNGTLYLGDVHHALIISQLIENGTHDWDSLIAAQQMWGWFETEDPDSPSSYDPNYDQNNAKFIGMIRFATDDAKQSYGVKAKVLQSFKEAFPWVVRWTMQKGTGSTTQRDYGARARRQYLDGGSRSDYDDDDYYEHDYD